MWWLFCLVSYFVPFFFTGSSPPDLTGCEGELGGSTVDDFSFTPLVSPSDGLVDLCFWCSCFSSVWQQSGHSWGPNSSDVLSFWCHLLLFSSLVQSICSLIFTNLFVPATTMHMDQDEQSMVLHLSRKPIPNGTYLRRRRRPSHPSTSTTVTVHDAQHDVQELVGGVRLGAQERRGCLVSSHILPHFATPHLRQIWPS